MLKVYKIQRWFVPIALFMSGWLVSTYILMCPGGGSACNTAITGQLLGFLIVFLSYLPAMMAVIALLPHLSVQRSWAIHLASLVLPAAVILVGVLFFSDQPVDFGDGGLWYGLLVVFGPFVLLICSALVARSRFVGMPASGVENG